ncbi:MAG: hypothetical protein HUK21_08710 [Fibrobacteraceae bacterium]|nr:hypothetical protein [Fibrobacteraceae bacterium]
MNFKYSLLVSTVASLFIMGCDSGSSSSPDDATSSSSVPSFNSSTSIVNTLDVAFNDTLKLKDTVNIYLDYFVYDTVYKEIVDSDSNIIIDSNKFEVNASCTDESLCIDRKDSSISLYLGNFKAGSRIQVSMSTSDMENDTLRILSDLLKDTTVTKEGDTLITSTFGEPLATVYPIYNQTKKDSIFEKYMIPGSGADMTSNTFINFKNGDYYLVLKAKFDSTSHIRVFASVDTAYYRYVGDDSQITMSLNDTLRGVSRIGKSPSKVKVNFEAEVGYSVTLNVSGKWINKYKLFENDSNEIAADTSGLDQLLLPEDSTKWTLQVYPLSVDNYLSGPYATFEAITTTRELGQGEYFAFPDSIVFPGDTLEINRARNDQAKYYLRQEQYVWLADLKKGDSIYVFHHIYGYETDASKPAIYAILNSKGDSVGTIGTYDYVFKAPKDGAYYLRYLRFNSNPITESRILSLYTLVQRPGMFKSMEFYDESTSKTYSDTRKYAVGDSVFFSSFSFMIEPAATSVSMKWFVPCEDLPVLGNASYITKYESGNCNGEQEISDDFLIVQKEASGETAHLIAESKADPLMRDTLTILVP